MKKEGQTGTYLNLFTTTKEISWHGHQNQLSRNQLKKRSQRKVDILSNMLISQIVVAFSVAMFVMCAYQKITLNRYSNTCLIVAVWLALEILSDYISISFSEYVTSIEAVRYYFILSSASLAMMTTTHLNGLYPKSIRIMFTAITFICVSMAFYRWGVQSRWDSWGADFYESYGLFLDFTFVCSIAAMDGLMIVLGFYSALDLISDDNDNYNSWRF